MDSEWIDARIDGIDLRAGDRVRLTNGAWVSPSFSVLGFDERHVLLTGSQRWPRDRRELDAYWQYHAPTRAKLVAEERAALFATETTYTARAKPIGGAVQPAPPVAQPQPPADSEPGWDHVPYERVGEGNRLHTAPGDRIRKFGEWVTVSRHGELTHPDTIVRRAAHPERVRWLAERSRVLNGPPSAAYVGEESTYARDDDARVVTVPVDPFAAVRAEAKRMLDDGADPRVVLGALDACVTSGQPGTWASAVASAVARYSVDAIERSMRAFRQRREGACYHGKRAGSCGWCALVHERSDSRAVASSEPAWETADCEGE